MIHARLLLLAPIASLAIAIAPGCSNTAPAVPQAGISVVVIPGPQNTSATCPVALPDNTWNIGGSALAPVKDGDSQSGAPVKVSCTVSAAGGGFDILGDVELLGKGSFTIQGHMDGTTNDQPNLRSTFVLSGGTGSWQEQDCTVSFPNKQNMGIAPGRVWAMVDCPIMKDANRGTSCDGSAEFRLENCNQ